MQAARSVVSREALYIRRFVLVATASSFQPDAKSTESDHRPEQVAQDASFRYPLTRNKAPPLSRMSAWPTLLHSVIDNRPPPGAIRSLQRYTPDAGRWCPVNRAG